MYLHWYYLTCLWDRYPTVYADDPERLTYVTMEECIRDCYGLWKDGYDRHVVVDGVGLESESETSVEGTVTDLSYLGDERHRSRLSLSDLSAYKTVTLDTGDETVEVGGWGAVFEDIEMRTVSLVDIDAGSTPFVEE